MTEEEKKRMKLEQELRRLRTKNGLNPENGRKVRRDKGCPRQNYNYNCYNPRRAYHKLDPYKHYCYMLKRRYDSKAQEYIEYDVNGYYYINEGKRYQVYKDYNDTTNNKKRHCVTQWEFRPLDLERYRFEGLQYQATNICTKSELVPLPNKDLYSWAHHCAGFNSTQSELYFKKKALTWEKYFCQFYHIDPRDVSIWTYDEWLRHYEHTPREELSEDFVFDIDHLPGTPEFYPEWSRVSEKLEQEKRDREIEAHNKRVWLSKINSRKGDRG